MFRHIAMIIVVCSVLLVPQHAQAAEPLYTIDHPRIVLHRTDHLVQIKWYQYVQSTPIYVIAFKITQSRLANPSCADVDWSEYLRSTLQYKYCFDLFRQQVPQGGYITITDTKWQRGDQYFIIQYVYTSHNAPYGAYIP
jgi:hypothetical protein